MITTLNKTLIKILSVGLLLATALMTAPIAGAQEVIIYTAPAGVTPLSQCCPPQMNPGNWGHFEGGKLFIAGNITHGNLVRSLDLATGEYKVWQVAVFPAIAMPKGAPNGSVGVVTSFPKRAGNGIGLFNPAINNFSKFWRLDAGFGSDPILGSRPIYDRDNNRILFTVVDGTSHKLVNLDTNTNAVSIYDFTPVYGTNHPNLIALAGNKAALIVKGSSAWDLVMLDLATGSGQVFNTGVATFMNHTSGSGDAAGNVYVGFAWPGQISGHIVMKYDAAASTITKILVSGGDPLGVIALQNGNAVLFGPDWSHYVMAWKPATNEIITVTKPVAGGRFNPTSVIVEEASSTLHVGAGEDGKLYVMRLPVF